MNKTGPAVLSIFHGVKFYFPVCSVCNIELVFGSNLILNQMRWDFSFGLRAFGGEDYLGKDISLQKGNGWPK